MGSLLPRSVDILQRADGTFEIDLVIPDHEGIWHVEQTFTYNRLDDAMMAVRNLLQS